MKLFCKAKDERVVAEINRIYKIGFYFLTFGILLDAVLMLAWAVSLFLMSRKGLMDDNAFAEADRFPLKIYLAQGVLAGSVAAIVVSAVQFVSGAAWVSMGVPYMLLAFAAQLLFMVPTVTVLVLLITYATFCYAKRRRARAQAQMDEEDSEDSDLQR